MAVHDHLHPTKSLFMLVTSYFRKDVADRFEVSCSTVSRIFTTWINFLYLKLEDIPQGYSRKYTQDISRFVSAPIQGSSEVYVQKPALHDLHQITFSNSNTYKVIARASVKGNLVLYLVLVKFNYKSSPKGGVVSHFILSDKYCPSTIYLYRRC